MTNFKNKLTQHTERVLPTAGERRAMREHLMAYMSYHPIRHIEVRPQARARNIFHILRSFGVHHIPTMLVVALIFSSTGMSYAATDALPGDLLYPIKVNVNEELKTALMFSEQAQLEWEQERVEKRLDEATHLAVLGKLDGPRKEQVARQLAEQTAAVQERVISVEDADPILAAEVSAQLETSLDTHEAILARAIVEQNGDAADDARSLVEQVRSATKEAGKIRALAEEKLDAVFAIPAASSSTSTSVEQIVEKGINSANLRERAAYRRQATAQGYIAEVRIHLTELDPTSDLALQVEAQLRSGERSMEEGARALADADFGTAYIAYRHAAAVAQKVTELLDTAALFDVEILPENTLEQEFDDTIGDTEAATEEEIAAADEALSQLRGETDGAIIHAQETLLTHEGFQEETTTRVNTLVKDAMAHQLRADIAIKIGDADGAHSLLERARHLSRNAGVALEEAIQNGEATAVSVPVALPDDAPVEHVDELPGLPRLDVVSVHHTQVDGTHTLSGVFYTPTPCFSVTATATAVADEGLRLGLTTTEEDGVCAQVLDAKEFVATVQAAPEAVLTKVTVNETEVTFEIVADGSDGTDTAAATDSNEEAPVAMPLKIDALPSLAL